LAVAARGTVAHHARQCAERLRQASEVSVLVSPTTAALCGIAVALVAAIWIAFYLFTFLPRGLLQ
jgi:hypothetical protein